MSSHKISGATIGAAAMALLMTGGARAASWTATGNEPGWHVEVSDQAIAFSTMDGAALTVTPLPKPTRASELAVYAATVDGKPFTLVAVDKLCTDTMSGMQFPKTVAVTVGETAYAGCGGDPLSLLLGDRRVIQIEGEPVVAGSEASIAFDLDGSVHGNASCNRFFGSYTLTGEGLTISNAGASMMACEEAFMQQEQRFLAALDAVRGFERAADGQLRLIGDDGRALVTAR
jgi:heat shock protein HslJ/uncharacterized membrane protein